MMGRITDEAITMLEKLGWSYLPYAPNEWQWLCFDEYKKQNAVQGADRWQKDLILIGYLMAPFGVEAVRWI